METRTTFLVLYLAIAEAGNSIDFGDWPEELNQAGNLFLDCLKTKLRPRDSESLVKNDSFVIPGGSLKARPTTEMKSSGSQVSRKLEGSRGLEPLALLKPPVNPPEMILEEMAISNSEIIRPVIMPGTHKETKPNGKQESKESNATKDLMNITRHS